MRSKSIRIKSKLSLPLVSICARVVTAIAVSIVLSACDGGISGTGDGGPVTIQPGDSADSTGNTNTIDSGIDSGSDSDVASPADSGDPTTQSPDAGDIALPLPDLSLLVPEALLQTTLRNDGISATVPFTTELITLTQEVNETIESISAAQTMQTTAISSRFNDSRFDNVLSFSIDGTDTIVASADATALRFFFSDNSARAIHLFQQDDTITLRRVDRNNNTVFQAKIVSVSESSTAIGAALNNNGMQLYLESYSTAEFTTAFTHHPADPTIPRQRELIDPDGAVSVVQTCTGAIAECMSDSDYANTDATTGTRFSNAAQAIANALSTPENAPLITLPDGVDEAVLATSVDAQPTEDQIQCGVQTVDNSIRLFCLRPLPLESDVSLFSETVAGGEIFYQRL